LVMSLMIGPFVAMDIFISMYFAPKYKKKNLIHFN
jgi:hypothetical protein